MRRPSSTGPADLDPRVYCKGAVAAMPGSSGLFFGSGGMAHREGPAVASKSAARSRSEGWSTAAYSRL